MSSQPGKSADSMTKFARFVAAFIAEDVMLRVRAYVMEHATVLEFDVNEVLAARLSRSIQASDELASSVFNRLPIDVRLGMLEVSMHDDGAEDLWPFLLPALRRVYELRNRYAHGIVETRRDGAVAITSWNRGRESTRVYEANELAWLAWQASVARIELARLWAFCVPADPPWHEA